MAMFRLVLGERKNHFCSPFDWKEIGKTKKPIKYIKSDTIHLHLKYVFTDFMDDSFDEIAE